MSENGHSLRLTKTQREMLAVLKDGQPHTRQELHACLWDEMARLSSIQRHITNLRKLLRHRGETILCVLHEGKVHYQHIRLLNSPFDGRI